MRWGVDETSYQRAARHCRAKGYVSTAQIALGLKITSFFKCCEVVNQMHGRGFCTKLDLNGRHAIHLESPDGRDDWAEVDTPSPSSEGVSSCGGSEPRRSNVIDFRPAAKADPDQPR